MDKPELSKINVETDLPNFPPGPLDQYRAQASFDWKRMKLFIEDERLLKFKPLTLIILLYEYDASLSLKYAIPFGFFFNALLALGQPKHLEFLDAANKEEISGCYALTEVAHGTNAKKMQTTATFDVKTQQFILHSAGFEAAKCWAGSLGKAATHGTVFAQLVTPDGVCHGLHAFIVPLRDPNTLLVHPGIIIGDMGEKLGLNAVDNGFAIFNQYRIPKDNLLNKIGSVTPSGQYVSPVKDSRKRFDRNTVHTTLLSLDREEHSPHYTAVTGQRGTQFTHYTDVTGRKLTLLLLVIVLQQWRLFPYIAAAFALKVYSEYSLKILVEFNIALMLNKRSDHMNNLGAEIHALQSSAKPLCSWTAQHGIQECREACGGHGYLSCESEIFPGHTNN
uniref:Acyl-CoA oxidase C-alpha1 domain-containing protein n=1 Tax=Timema cristinae TaxID=61476 RepID=A0A7R9CY54_TIMCR|nr:unnamed protein product [Timema cristinae]